MTRLLCFGDHKKKKQPSISQVKPAASPLTVHRGTMKGPGKCIFMNWLKSSSTALFTMFVCSLASLVYLKINRPNPDIFRKNHKLQNIRGFCLGVGVFFLFWLCVCVLIVQNQACKPEVTACYKK